MLPMRRPAPLALLALALALAAGPAAAAAPVRFLHARHVEFVSLRDESLRGDARCTTCHALPATGTPPPSARRGCERCHEEYVPEFTPARLAPRGFAALAVPFPHERHAGSARLACVGCHRPAAGSISLTADRDCLGCHAREQVDGRACSACHPADVRATLPADHRGGWRRSVHPLEAEHAQGRHGHDCATCHGTDPCARCHREREPQDHAGLFKARLHGTAASWDRERCATCHETGTCARCHATTRPANHGASWRSVHMLAAGGVGNESCAVCHHRSFCAGCHGGAP